MTAGLVDAVARSPILDDAGARLADCWGRLLDGAACRDLSVLGTPQDDADNRGANSF